MKVHIDMCFMMLREPGRTVLDYADFVSSRPNTAGVRKSTHPHKLSLTVAREYIILRFN